MAEKEVNRASLYLPFDQYFYRNAIEMCTNYAKEYSNSGLGNSVNKLRVAKRLSNLFQSILYFAEGCEDLPDHLRNPPLDDWNVYGTDPNSPLALHATLTMEYVMDLMNEIKRQEADISISEEEFISDTGEEIE